jgi:hypothetical protein
VYELVILSEAKNPGTLVRADTVDPFLPTNQPASQSEAQTHKVRLL